MGTFRHLLTQPILIFPINMNIVDIYDPQQFSKALENQMDLKGELHNAHGKSKIEGILFEKFKSQSLRV